VCGGGVQRLICKHNQLSEPIQDGNFFAETKYQYLAKSQISGVRTTSEENPFVTELRKNKNSGNSVSTSECLFAFFFFFFYSLSVSKRCNGSC